MSLGGVSVLITSLVIWILLMIWKAIIFNSNTIITFYRVYKVELVIKWNSLIHSEKIKELKKRKEERLN